MAEMMPEPSDKHGPVWSAITRCARWGRHGSVLTMPPADHFELLSGPEGQTTPVLRHGDTVLRPAGPWTPTVHALLIHLENAGFTGSPRVVGNGYDGHGREVLTYIPGDTVDPHAWSDEGIWHVGRLLHDLHDATAGFQPPPDAVLAPLALPQRRTRRHHQSPRHRTLEHRRPRRPPGRLHRLADRWADRPARRDRRYRLAERATPRRRHRRTPEPARCHRPRRPTAPLPGRLPAGSRRSPRLRHQDDRVRHPRLRCRSHPSPGDTRPG